MTISCEGQPTPHPPCQVRVYVPPDEFTRVAPPLAWSGSLSPAQLDTLLAATNTASVELHGRRRQVPYYVKRSTRHTHTHTDREQHPRHTRTRQEQHPTPPNEHLPQTLNNARRCPIMLTCRSLIQYSTSLPVYIYMYIYVCVYISIYMYIALALDTLWVEGSGSVCLRQMHRVDIYIYIYIGLTPCDKTKLSLSSFSAIIVIYVFEAFSGSPRTRVFSESVPQCDAGADVRAAGRDKRGGRRTARAAAAGRIHTNTYICMYVYIYICIYLYI